MNLLATRYTERGKQKKLNFLVSLIQDKVWVEPAICHQIYHNTRAKGWPPNKILRIWTFFCSIWLSIDVQKDVKRVSSMKDLKKACVKTSDLPKV